MNQIEKLWKEIQKMHFPSHTQRKDIDGINPYEIASLATDCISSYFDSDQELERDKKEKLKQCMEDLRTITLGFAVMRKCILENFIGCAILCISFKPGAVGVSQICGL